MKRLLSGLLCAVVVLACSAVAVQAAQIVYTGNDTTTGVAWYDGWYSNGTPGPYGGGGGAGFDISSGSPDYGQGPPTWVPANPNWLDFVYSNNGGGGGGGGGNNSGGGGGTTGITYDLTTSEDKTFNFEVLFYDANYLTRNPTLAGTDVALSVRLIEPAANPDPADGWLDITVDELLAGIYMVWLVEAPAGETITTEVVWVSGDGVGAAAFFLDNVVDGVTIPEPATISFIAFGLGAMFLRRRK